MKVCPKCYAKNEDTMIQCVNCGEYITRTNMDEKNDSIKEMENEAEKKRKKRMLAKNIILFLIGAAYLFLYVKAILNGEVIKVTFYAALFAFLAYLGIRHPKVVFNMENFFAVKNIEEVELSDLYIYVIKVSGYICAMIGFVIMSIYAF